MRRRDFLKATSASALLSCGGAKKNKGIAPAGNPGRELIAPKGAAFLHGVASGDPLANRVILWTRISGLRADSQVDYLLALDAEMTQVVKRGRTAVRATRDHTVKVDVDGLEPGQTYYYRFQIGALESRVGRTRTLPAGNTEHLRLGFCSCSSLPWGFFNAYARLAERADLAAVLHLGDYIYEYKNGEYGDGTDIGRIPLPDRELLSLDDYRIRHRQYKEDVDAQTMHAQHPVIAIWDDHEFADDAWRGGAGNHQPNEGVWAKRREAAVRAYLEWMPIREAAGDQSSIYRGFRFGDLVDLSMLDTRLIGRDQQLPEGDPGLTSDKRSLLGEEQETWLGEQLRAAKEDKVAWSLLGQQVLVSPVQGQDPKTGLDKWQGYPAARKRLLDSIRKAGRDAIVLTGDLHSSWAIDVPDTEYRVSEFVVPGVSSPGSLEPDKAPELVTALRAANPDVQWIDILAQGYAVLDISRDQAQCDWFFVPTVRQRSGEQRFARGFVATRGSTKIAAATGPKPSLEQAPALAPVQADSQPVEQLPG